MVFGAVDKCFSVASIAGHDDVFLHSVHNVPTAMYICEYLSFRSFLRCTPSLGGRRNNDIAGSCMSSITVLRLCTYVNYSLRRDE